METPMRLTRGRVGVGGVGDGLGAAGRSIDGPGPPGGVGLRSGRGRTGSAVGSSIGEDCIGKAALAPTAAGGASIGETALASNFGVGASIGEIGTISIGVGDGSIGGIRVVSVGAGDGSIGERRTCRRRRMIAWSPATYKPRQTATPRNGSRDSTVGLPIGELGTGVFVGDAWIIGDGVGFISVGDSTAVGTWVDRVPPNIGVCESIRVGDVVGGGVSVFAVGYCVGVGEGVTVGVGVLVGDLVGVGVFGVGDFAAVGVGVGVADGFGGVSVRVGTGSSGVSVAVAGGLGVLVGRGGSGVSVGGGSGVSVAGSGGAVLVGGGGGGVLVGT